MKHSHQSALYRFSLYYTFLIDLMGYFIVLPIFAPLILSDSAPWKDQYSYEWRSLFFASLIFVYAFLQWISPSFFSFLTSIKGKKSVLLLSLSVCLLAYVVTAFGVLHGSLTLLFLGRVLAGFFSGNISMLSGANTLSSRFWSISSGSFGLVLGPLLVGVLGDASLHVLFFNALPFWLMAVLLLLNVILISLLKEDIIISSSWVQISFWREFAFFFSFWKKKKWRWQCSSLSLYFVGWFLFIQFISAYLFLQFGFSESAIGFSIAAGGAFWCINLFFEKRFTWIFSRGGAFFNYTLLGLGALSLLLIFYQEWFFFIAMVTVMMFVSSFIWTHVGTFFSGSNDEEADEINQFIYVCSAFSAVVAAFFGGVSLILNFQLLYSIIGICFMLSAIALRIHFKQLAST